MAISRGPRLITNGLVLALDPSDDNSFAAQNLPIKNGLALWLDAADDDSFVYSSGTSVSQWRDKSGLNNHVAQSTVASQPNRNVVKNSRKSVYFDGGDTLFNSGNVFPSNTTDYTKIAVVYQTSTATTGNVISSNTDLGGGVNHAFFFNGSTNIRLYHGGTFVTSTVSLSINTIGIITGTFTYSSGDGTIYVNGSAAGTGTTANKTIPRDISIGSYVGGNNFTGEICEVLVFSRVLSATELKQVHNYLGQKWGIVNTDKSVVDTSGGTYVGLLGNGTTSAMPVYDFYNKGALKFDGTDDYIVGTVPSIAASSTVGMWIKSASYNNKIPFSIAGAIYGSGPNIFFSGNFINWNTGDGSSNSFSGSSYPDSNWHYIVVTNDAATNAKLYIDGTLIGTAIYKNTLSTNSNNLWLGRFSGDNNYTINANIAGTQIYNRVLSATEVLQNYNAQKGKYLNTIVQQGLVLNLDAGNPYSYAGAGTTWYDTSGNNYNGTLTFGPTYSSDNGGSIVFDGQNDYVSIPSNSNFNNGNNITVEAWVRCSNWGNFSHAMIVAKGINVEWILWKSNDAGVVGKLGWRAAGQAYSTTTLLDNVWYQCVGSVGSSGTKVYVNGVLEGTNGTTVFTSGNIDVTIAAGLVSGSPSNILGANIAVTRIYNRQLTDSEVLQNYNATKGRFGL